MNFSKYILLVLLGFFALSCQQSDSNITSTKDYGQYLMQPADKSNEALLENYAFWQEKLDGAPGQHPYLAKMAGIQTEMFLRTGDIAHLVTAEDLLERANEATAYNQAGYLRMLAHNAISQHQFPKALDLLRKAEANGEDLTATQKMLFDVHMELGNTTLASQYLSQLFNEQDFDYLIRASKWEDHEGRLDRAIVYMERATALAESRGDEALKQWSYTNLADFYGHAGRIEDSYQHYLKALSIDPHDAYAKKGIAWIAFSYERDPEAALHILESVALYHKSPDHFLLMSEIAAFQGDEVRSMAWREAFLRAASDERYGDMYNAHFATILTDDQETGKARKLAEREIEMRPTPHSWSLLAWTYYQEGDAATALEIAEREVADKSFEPAIQYQLAEIYKANEMPDRVAMLKGDLQESIYELGPLMETKINSL